MTEEKKFNLSKEELSNLLSRRSVLDYLANLLRNDEVFYIREVILPRLSLPTERKVKIDLKEGFLVDLGEDIKDEKESPIIKSSQD